MLWTGHDEADVRCENLAKPVNSEESVARLLHSTLIPIDDLGLRRKDLFPEDDKKVDHDKFSNECGNSDGMSVDRSDDLTAEELWSRSERLAKLSKNKNRSAAGAHVATVKDLRDFRIPHYDGQVLFVYEDPIVSENNEIAQNIEHAVVRASEKIKYTDRQEVLQRTRKIFKTKIEEINKSV